ncbi:carbohydrate-binding protein SusD [Pelobium manganitolerans]|uniref:Carbohydrate-binding protein SusD n=1 Tax=Pelobium manganitolerans TaxID=1842495 RepID=A0A419S7L3_9SPHI|nr:RagB/SusD family nutrient uptake outer membrane protein [Pelobium manganitolerans]RKD17156.1 carbohydrate-binding protein SusD [Pelobium manganitolerans]
MKTYSKYILLLAAVCLSTVSCKKFLTTDDSASDFTQEYIFSNQSDASKAVYSVYALFNQDAFTSRLSNNFTGNSDVEVGGVGASPDNSRRDIWSFEATDANNDLRTVWNNAYSAINRANLCEEGLMQSSLAETPGFQQLLGEVKTLRAYWYYALMNHWGDVPFSHKPTRAGDNFYLPRTGRDTILTFLIDDLIEIEPKMMWADQLDYGIERINREYVMGMIAKLALMRGGYWLYPDNQMRRKDDYLKYYKIASDYCQKLETLKPHILTPSFAQIFENENKYKVVNNEDVLFEVAFQPGFGDVAWCNGVRVDGGDHPYGAGSNYLSLTPTYYHSFDTLDTRLEATCSIIYYDKFLQQTPTAVTSIAPNKWNRLKVPTPLGSASAKGTGINWPMMRYSDVLLMLAEAENELNNGPNSIATAALKRVRTRAFAGVSSTVMTEKVDTYVNNLTTKEAFFNAIVNERAWEFGGECIRKYDLERWNLYGEKVAETRNALKQMGEDANAGVGAYSDLPDYLYYKINSDRTVTFLNRYKKIAQPANMKDVPNKGDNPEGYLKATWLKGLYDTKTSGPASYVLVSWRGYQDDTGQAPLRYILPVHSSVISGSLGVINNSGYGYD